VASLSDSPAHPPVLRSIALATMGYACFAAQDAIVKWLVAHLPVWQVLFSRSLVILALLAVTDRSGAYRSAIASRSKPALAGRAVLILVAWLSYYTASRSLGLAQLVTLYFAAPIFVVVLSVVMLKERVTPPRWAAVLGGFAGVVLAAGPSLALDAIPAAMTLFAALTWAMTTILVRIISRRETTPTQMVVSNFLFAVACGVALPWIWVTPSATDLVLLVGLGIVGGSGQFLVFESFRLAPAAAVAPFEYTNLVWAFILGYVIWHDIPGPMVFAGAGLIVLSGVGLILAESRAEKRR
jgi:S-adenosylmethionine uptake transporter